MSATFSDRATRRRAVSFVAVLVASVLMLATSSNPLVVELQGGLAFALKPVQTAVDTFAGSLTSIATAMGEIDSLRTENDGLRAENERIRLETLQAKEIRRQNELLTGLLQLRNGFEYKTIAAAVIGRESIESQQRIVIDRGTNDGIVVGDVVIAAGGALVGRVVDARATSSVVQLISDSGSTVIGQLIGSAATGEVTGELATGLLMENIDASTTVGLGEEVVTAGIELAGGIRSPYPKGLVIGQVIDVSRDANQIVQTAFLEPAAALDRLEFVLVITDYQGGLPPVDQQPTNCQPNPDGTIPAGEQPCIEASPKP